jgi:hypothetical protein
VNLLKLVTNKNIQLAFQILTVIVDVLIHFPGEEALNIGKIIQQVVAVLPGPFRKLKKEAVEECVHCGVCFINSVKRLT